MPHWHMTDQQAAERIAAVLDDLTDLHRRSAPARTHYDDCWHHHVGCLAVRIRRTLTGEEPR